MHYTSILVTLVSLELLSLPAYAQRAGRLVRVDEAACLVTATGTIEYGVDATQPTLKTLATSVTATGDLSHWSQQPDDFHLLVGGRDAQGRGCLLHYCQADQLTSDFVLKSSITLTGQDVAGVYFDKDNSRLYYLDSIAKRIKLGTWDGVANLSTVTFANWVTVADTPALQDAANLRLKATMLENIVLYPALYHTAIQPHVIVRKDNGVVTTELVGDYFRVHWTETDIKDGLTSLTVAGVNGTQFEVVDTTTNTVIGSGVVPANGSIAVSVATPFTLGHRYLTRETGDPHSSDPGWAHPCLRRIGHSEPLDTTTSMGPFQLKGQTTSGGLYRARVRIRTDPPPSSPVSYNAFFAVAVAAPGDPPPVVPAGSNFMLDLSVSELLSTTAYVPSGSGYGQAAVSFQISPDPSLIGMVGYGQFGVDDANNNLKLSEIGGMLLQPAGLTIGQSTSTGTTGRFFKDAPSSAGLGWVRQSARKRLGK